MYSTDMVTAEFIDQNTYNLYDLYSTGKFQPSNDVSQGGSYDLSNKIFTFNKGLYTLTFDRLLNTNDKFDYVIQKVNNSFIN